MDLQTLIRNIDAATAQSFVTAARHVIDALMIEAKRVEQTQTPARRAYGSGGSALSRDTPPGGWISHDELRETTRKMSEAIAGEHWIDGALFAIRALSTLGAL